MGVTSFLLVSCLGLAITAQAQNCSKPASGPNMSLKDQYILLGSFSDGTRVSFKCNVGYTPEGGSPFITCTAGSWSRLTLICERKSCGSLEEKPYTLYDYKGNQFGDVVVITCAEGYRMPGAEQKKELLCGDQGWMGRQPVCEAVTCDPPPSIVNGSYNPINEHYSYRDVVQYSCKSNLILNGSKTRTCSEDGTFKPAAPTCVSVECKEPVIPNGEWIDGARPPYKYQSSMTYTCKQGYTMEGSPTVKCGINSQWLPGVPQCKPVTCIPPPEVVNGTYSPKKSLYEYKDVVQYSCRTQDFKLSGSDKRTCSLDGTFKPAAPTCVLVECKDPKMENADQIEGSPPYRLNNKVTFKCKPGYEMMGAPTMTCDESNEWTHAPTCKKLPTTTTTTTTTTNNNNNTSSTNTPPKDDASSTNSWAIPVGVTGGAVGTVGTAAVVANRLKRKKRGTQDPVKEVANEEGVELTGKHDTPVDQLLS